MPAPVPAPAESEPEPPELASEPRALAPDLARGWMLLLIAIANVSAYLWGHGTLPFMTHPPGGTGLDRALSTLAILFVDGRVYPMFAFLFGYGMVQFARARDARGVPRAAVRGMFLRRHWWLLAFGLAHAALLFSGDILGAYGLTGLALTASLFWHSDRVLRFAAWVMLGLFALGAAAMLGLALLVTALSPDGAQTILTDDTLGSDIDLMSGVADYGWAMLVRLGIWIAATPATVLSLLVPACVVLGWLAGRHRWLETAGSRVGLGSVGLWGVLAATLAAAPVALIHLGLVQAFDPVAWALVLLDQFAGVAGGIGYAALFGLVGLRLRARGRARAAARPVAALGRRSLSGYLLQSVVFAPLLSAWGLGIGARIGTTAAFGIAAGTWVLSLLLAALLEHRGARGPAEALLRRLTYANLDRAAAVPEAPTR